MIPQRVAIEGDEVVLRFDLTGTNITVNVNAGLYRGGREQCVLNGGECAVRLTPAQAREYARRIEALADILEFRP